MQNDPNDILLVVRKSSNALDFIDTGSGSRIGTVDVGVAPHEVSLSPDGRRAAVSNYGPADRPGTTIRLIDVERAELTATIDILPNVRPHGLTWISQSRIAATSEGAHNVLIVNADDRTVETAIATGQEHSHMIVADNSGTRAFVANITSGTVTAIDLGSARKIADIATGMGSEGLTLTRDGGEVWVCVRAEDRIAVVDSHSLEIVSSIPTPKMPIRVVMSPIGGTAYVTCAAAGVVLAIDVAARKVTGNHAVNLRLAPGAESRQFAHLGPGSPLPIGLAVSRSAGTIYVAATMSDCVQALDPSTLDAMRTIEVGGEPDGIAVSAIGRRN
ncbi:MAG: hypothetical protein ACO1NY_06490 [Pseudorhodoplanes sp.]